ncbi:cell wall-binding repeat 2 family protein, partial [Thermococcus sp. Bubb.Bath]|nr:cell wall-binding repeat 2 family protein [Thermococcus sp. Bubb.Bath]
MIGKKVLAILFGLLMLAMPVSFTGVSAATESVTVILVSDNAADKCIA